MVMLPNGWFYTDTEVVWKIPNHFCVGIYSSECGWVILEIPNHFCLSIRDEMQAGAFLRL